MKMFLQDSATGRGKRWRTIAELEYGKPVDIATIVMKKRHGAMRRFVRPFFVSEEPASKLETKF